MPQIYLQKDLYDELIKRGHEVTIFVNNAIKRELEREEKKKE